MSVSLKCKRCGSSIKEYYKHCNRCGYELSSVADVEMRHDSPRLDNRDRSKTYAQLLAEGKSDKEIVSETVNVVQIKRKNARSKNLLFWHLYYFVGGYLVLPLTRRLTSSGTYDAFLMGLLIMASIVAVTVYASGTALVVPMAALGMSSTITDDITRARGRMFEKLLGPLIGYFYAALLFTYSVITNVLI